MKNKQLGFTLVELLTVGALLVVVMTLAIISFNRSRVQGRDTKRIHDIKEIQTALELYYNRNNYYPTLITSGQNFIENNITYLNLVPSNPEPKNDGNCGNNEYTYAAVNNNNDYSINFCLGNKNSEATIGANALSKNGLNTSLGLVGWWKFEEETGASIKDSTGSNNTCATQGSGEKIELSHGQLNSCKTGLCTKFDGSDELYLDCGTSNDFIINTGTISLWFNAASDIVDNGNRLIEIGKSDASERIGLVWSSSSLKLHSFKGGVELVNLSSQALATNTWYYAVATWDNAGASIYIKKAGLNYANGVVGDMRLDLPLDATKMYIGNAINNSSGHTWSGHLDDIRIYNRVLSTNEIQAIYDSLK